MIRVHPCAGCRFFFGEYEHNRCCNYIFIMDRRRPCPVGEGCTVKEIIPEGKISYRRYAKDAIYADAVQQRLIVKKCARCGTEFYTRKETKIYCSEACRNSAKERRRYLREKERK